MLVTFSLVDHYFWKYTGLLFLIFFLLYQPLTEYFCNSSNIKSTELNKKGKLNKYFSTPHFQWETMHEMPPKCSSRGENVIFVYIYTV